MGSILVVGVGVSPRRHSQSPLIKVAIQHVEQMHK